MDEARDGRLDPRQVLHGGADHVDVDVVPRGAVLANCELQGPEHIREHGVVVHRGPLVICEGIEVDGHRTGGCSLVAAVGSLNAGEKKLLVVNRRAKEHASIALRQLGAPSALRHNLFREEDADGVLAGVDPVAGALAVGPAGDHTDALHLEVGQALHLHLRRHVRPEAPRHAHLLELALRRERRGGG